MKYSEYQLVVNYCFGFKSTDNKTGEVVDSCIGYLNEQGVDASVKVKVRRLLISLNDSYEMLVKELNGKDGAYVKSEIEKDFGIDCKILELEEIKGLKAAFDYSVLLDKIVK